MSLSVFTIKSATCILVITKENGTIARKTGSLFVQFIPQEISQATSSFTFWTRNSILETRSSILETQTIKDRVSRLQDWGSRDCQLTFERYCIWAHSSWHVELKETLNIRTSTKIVNTIKYRRYILIYCAKTHYWYLNISVVTMAPNSLSTFVLFTYIYIWAGYCMYSTTEVSSDDEATIINYNYCGL